MIFLMFFGFCNYAHAGAAWINKLVIDQTNPSGTVTGTTIDITQFTEYSIQIIATGTVACTAVINVSNDDDNRTMIALAGSSTAFTNTGLIYTIKGGYRYVQLVTSGCAGAGSLKAYFVAKEI